MDFLETVLKCKRKVSRIKYVGGGLSLFFTECSPAVKCGVVQFLTIVCIICRSKFNTTDLHVCMYIIISFSSPFTLSVIRVDINIFVYVNVYISCKMSFKIHSSFPIKGVVNCQNSKAIVPVGKPRPYSIIILNMRFIPKASLRASSQITASSYILERHL